jgi:ribosomal protein S18 acetylase RimI-like enzyme
VSTTPALAVREIGAEEFGLVWPIFQAVVAAGDTYAYDPAIPYADAQALWTKPPARCFVAEEGSEVVGAYCLRPNQVGLGDHVANAGYMVSPGARGRGIAGTMCEHSLEVAREARFHAMQFNFVVATNEAAVRLWQRYGFQIVGRVPQAFRHRERGLTDVYVMYRKL